ncbi:MAG TPA: alpha/beta hydrolase [Candidatus Acidoferrales bacterium]|nr:alpha/beta hydrolase [Candidatus Acidoferrales bacterium]
MKSLLAALLAFGTVALGALAQEKAVPYGDNPAAGHYYPIHGIQIYCEIYGSGKPLLMIHGNGGSISSFRHNLPYFAARYQVIVADSRAQGKSKDSGDALTFEMMADDEAALLDTLHVHSAYVIGWSDGGINALLLAMRHPEKVIKLAATGANLWPDASAFAPGVWEEDQKEYDADKDKPRKTEEEKNHWKLFLLDWNEPHIALADLHSIHCPSLIICGDHDLISLEHTVRIYQNIPQAALWVVPRSGHATLIEHADDFNRVVDDFFSTPFQPKK